MNFFKGIAQAIMGFFKSDNAQKILKLGLQILQIVLGDTAAKLHQIAKEEVLKAENAGVEDKYSYAYKNIVARLKSEKFAEAEINLAIELAVAALRKELLG